MRGILARAAVLGALLAGGCAGGAGAATITSATTAGSGSSRLTIVGRGFSPRSAVVVAQCSQQAIQAAATAVASALDDCDAHYVAVASTGVDGTFTTTARALPVIDTASGPVDCRRVACLLGALNLDALQGKPLQVAVLPLHVTGSPAPLPPARPAPRLRARAGTAAPGHPFAARVTAWPAGRMGPGRIGTVVRLPARPLPRRPARGEGLLALTMSAPGTSWASRRDTSVVVRVRVDRGNWQTMVLFAGARRFTYEGFTGPLRTGPHTVQVRVNSTFSHVSGMVPSARVAGVSLRVLDPRSAAGFALAHAPVLYDRRMSAMGDTPLLTYATVGRLPRGSRRLTYVVIWTHEDAGTGFVPWLEWGSWGRMTDIETAISFDVAPSGATRDATYLTCSQCGPSFPENRTALNEVYEPFAGRWYQGHPVLRVSTGNNDFSDVGTTPLRFQPALAAPPRPGDTREGSMDRNPWTYGVMGQELRRERDDYSTDPASAAPGDPRQYLVLQLDTTVHDAAAVGVDIRLAGQAQTWSNDLGTTYPLYDGGQGRTVVKLPLAQAGRPIAMLRLRLLPGAGPGTPSIGIHALKVLQYTRGVIVRRRIPPPIVTIEPPAPAAVGAPTILPAGSSLAGVL